MSTFEEFLNYIREVIGSYCSDEYWRFIWEAIAKEWSFTELRENTSFLAISAISTDYISVYRQ